LLGQNGGFVKTCTIFFQVTDTTYTVSQNGLIDQQQQHRQQQQQQQQRRYFEEDEADHASKRVRVGEY
jgi:hypothetical protein